MKTWTKPAVREQEVGLEVTSYLPAEIDLIKVDTSDLNSNAAAGNCRRVFLCVISWKYRDTRCRQTAGVSLWPRRGERLGLSEPIARNRW